MKKHIGITLGPIGRIASYADDTKGLWATSYIFSYIGKCLVKNLFKNQNKVIKPYITAEMFETSNGVGFFPDQYIIEANEGDFETLCNTCDNILNDLGVLIASQLNKDAPDIIEYIKNTIKVYIIEKEIDDNEDIIKTMDNYLNAIECHDLYQHIQTENYLAQFFNKVIDSFLTIDAFNKEERRLFNTVIEYSAYELFNEITTEKDRNSLIKDIENGKTIDKLKPYHKHIAIVSADGDHIGKAFAALKEKSSILNKALLEYNLLVSNIVSCYGGQSVFQGGDDLLFFAPVYNGKETIFTLINEINNLFKEKVSDKCASVKEQLEGKMPTLSFGLSVSYYKHPMFEAHELSNDLLCKAKNTGRNRICAQICKHSGQTTILSLDKASKTYEKSLDLIKLGLTLGKTNEFLHSTTYWLMNNKEILNHILSCEMDNEVMLKNYFTNSFDEDIHQISKENNFFDTLQNYLIESPKETAVEDLSAILRFIELLNSTRK
jgi:CRISPR-associated protein Cmr2